MRLTKRDLVPWLLVPMIVALLLVPLPADALNARWPALVKELEDFVHPLAFGWLAHFAFSYLRARATLRPLARHLFVLAGAGALGVATEAAQAMTGRDSSWTDLANDMLGAGFALLLHARADRTDHGGRRAITLFATAVAALAIAPLATTAIAYAARQTLMPVLWQDGSLVLGRFSYRQHGEYAGLVIDEPIPDWRSWGFLEVDIENRQRALSRVVVRVNDREHNQVFSDRYNETFPLQAGERVTLRIPLDRIRYAPHSRPMDMAAIRGVVIFAPEKNDSLDTFTVHEVRLAR